MQHALLTTKHVRDESRYGLKRGLNRELIICADNGRRFSMRFQTRTLNLAFNSLGFSSTFFKPNIILNIILYLYLEYQVKIKYSHITYIWLNTYFIFAKLAKTWHSFTEKCNINIKFVLLFFSIRSSSELLLS